MEFAIEVLRLVDQLPHTSSGFTVSKQLARCGSGIGANYRSARTARSRAEFIAKLGIVVEEAEETTFWLELIERSHMPASTALRELRLEAGELLAIFAKSLGTARVNSRAHSHKQPSGQLAK